jgi:predicted TIM-barrel fold metal-dependent hydrolase
MNRREFIEAAALAAALPARNTAAAGAVTGAGATAQTTEPFRIDCQSHLYVPELLTLMQGRQTSPRAYRQGRDLYVVVNQWVRKVLPRHTDVAAKVADMDAAQIRTTMLSINDPGPELFGADGPKVARLAHDYLSDVMRAHPSRFMGLATLPLQDMEASLQELDRCVNKLGFRGVLLYSNLDGSWPDEPRYRPLFRRAEEIGVPILLHPACPTTFEQTKGYEMAPTLGLMFDTSIALTRIILAGMLDEFPKLNLVCPHVGGTVPYLVGRMDHQTQVLKRGAEHIRKPPSEYLRGVWLDAVSPLPQAIKYGCDFVGVDRMLYSSDHPWVDPKLIISCIHQMKLPAADEQKIYAANAQRLFRL